MPIKIHSEEEFEGMRKAGKLASHLLDYITPFVQPGVSTGKLNDLCHEWTLDHGATSAPLGYKGFPSATCTSVNHVVCHGFPQYEKVLKEGDIINIDVTPILDGYYGDTSRTFTVGKVGIKARRLIDTTYQAMMAGISVVKPGAHIGDIGSAISEIAHSNHFSVVYQFCGHGIDRNVFHCEPQVLHISKKGEGLEIQKGWFFTIEPMINEKKPDTKILDDGWTAVTRDHGLSAQFEHTIGVTEDGCEIFTLSGE